MTASTVSRVRNLQRLTERGMHRDAGRRGDVRGLRRRTRARIHAVDHAAEQVRMDGADDGILGDEARGHQPSQHRWHGRWRP